MFGLYFGEYLRTQGFLTSEKLNDVMYGIKESRIRLGLLAVEANLLTPVQATEINRIQASMDKRFGDIAVARGYLSESQVSKLLNKQGNSYMLFIQTLIDRYGFSMEQLYHEMDNFQEQIGFSFSEFEALKSGELDHIVPLFTKDIAINTVQEEYIALLMRNLLRFIDNDIRIEKAEYITRISFPYFSSQRLSGDSNIFTALASEGPSFLDLGSTYANEDFTIVNSNVLDAVCEFLNCNNGLFVSKLSNVNEIEIDMHPPVIHLHEREIVAGEILDLKIHLSGKPIHLLLSINQMVSIQ